jgi:general stress protein 26
MDEALRSRILEVLRRQRIMTVATIRPDGYPQATTVNYIHDDLIVYFATAATSQKAGNIKINNKVSVAIVDQAEDFYKLRGLSMSGTAASKRDKGLRNLLCGYFAGSRNRGRSFQKIQRSLQSTKSGPWLLR